MTGNHMFWNTQHVSVRISKTNEEIEEEKRKDLEDAKNLSLLDVAIEVRREKEKRREVNTEK